MEESDDEEPGFYLRRDLVLADGYTFDTFDYTQECCLIHRVFIFMIFLTILLRLSSWHRSGKIVGVLVKGIPMMDTKGYLLVFPDQLPHGSFALCECSCSPWYL